MNWDMHIVINSSKLSFVQVIIIINLVLLGETNKNPLAFFRLRGYNILIVEKIFYSVLIIGKNPSINSFTSSLNSSSSFTIFTIKGFHW